jgi:large subunit ribosomal protein L17
MNKKVFGRKLSRSRPAREALFATLVRSMILSGKIETTMAKAKAVQGDLEHMITLAKKADLSSRRRALAYLDNQRKINDILFMQIGPFFKTRQSGFTRITSLPARRGDNAKMARIEWTEKVEISSKKLEVSKKDKKEKAVKTKKVVKKEIKAKTKS